MKIHFYFIFFLFTAPSLGKGQERMDRLFISYGYKAIPLHIDRTNVNRWMIFPSFEAGYRINNKVAVSCSYLLRDIRLSNYSGDRAALFKETPKLNSYEEALMYLGNKYTVSQFYSYLFAGANYSHFKSKSFELETNLELGLRFGYTMVLSHISKQPAWPNGFEVHSSAQISNSPGMKLSISPKLFLFDFLYIEVSTGSFIFTNWPEMQPFGNFQIGISL